MLNCLNVQYRLWHTWLSTILALCLPLTVAAADDAQYFIRSELAPANALTAQEAETLGVNQEPNRLLLQVRVIKKIGSNENPVEAQIFAGATCKEAGLLTLPLRRAGNNTQVSDFRLAHDDQCRFLINASLPGILLRDYFNYAAGKTVSSR